MSESFCYFCGGGYRISAEEAASSGDSAFSAGMVTVHKMLSREDGSSCHFCFSTMGEVNIANSGQTRVQNSQCTHASSFPGTISG